MQGTYDAVCSDSVMRYQGKMVFSSFSGINIVDTQLKIRSKIDITKSFKIQSFPYLPLQWGRSTPKYNQMAKWEHWPFNPFKNASWAWLQEKKFKDIVFLSLSLSLCFALSNPELVSSLSHRQVIISCISASHMVINLWEGGERIYQTNYGKADIKQV